MSYFQLEHPYFNEQANTAGTPLNYVHGVHIKQWFHVQQ